MSYNILWGPDSCRSSAIKNLVQNIPECWVVFGHRPRGLLQSPQSIQACAQKDQQAAPAADDSAECCQQCMKHYETLQPRTPIQNPYPLQKHICGENGNVVFETQGCTRRSPAGSYVHLTKRCTFQPEVAREVARDATKHIQSC